jgi:hypothetical protein
MVDEVPYIPNLSHQMKHLLLRLFGLLPTRPNGHPPFAFRDQNGTEYYAFEHVGKLPPNRLAQVQDIMLQIDAGIMHKDAEALGDFIGGFIDEAAEAKDPKARTKALSKARFALNELVTRPRKIIHEEAYYALAALSCVRKDEDPEVFDEAIHFEKVEAFRSAGRAGLRFFTDTPILVTLLGALLSTKAGFTQSLSAWVQMEARRNAVLKVAS